MSQIVPLDFLNSGEAGTIYDVTGDVHQVQRLNEMGLRTGVYIQMLQPGEPCILAVENQRLSLRHSDDLQVLVSVN